MIANTTSTRHTAIYARVSSNRQDLRSQLPDLQAWEQGHAGTCRRYEDKSTGKTMDRPGWQKLWEQVRQGKVSDIVVWRIDRLGRTAAGLTQLFEDLQKYRVNLISLKDGLDLSTPAGRLMANLLAGVAQFESEVRGERVRAGQAVARSHGKRWGGSEPGRRYKVTDAHIRTIHRMRVARESVAEIVRVVKLSKPTVLNILKTNPGSTDEETHSTT